MNHPHHAAWLLLLSALPIAAQAPAPARPAPRGAIGETVLELGTDAPQVMAHLEYLCTRIGPRLTSSSDLTRACQWARARFAAWGLDARLEEWGNFPVGFERGPATGGMVAPVEIDYVFGTHAWTSGTPGPVRARAALAPKSVEDLEARRAELAGAWLVELARNDRPKGQVRKDVEAALAAIPLAGRVRGVGSLVHTGGNHQVDWSDLPSEVVINLQQAFYDDLLARLGRGEAVELEFDVDNRFTPGPVPQYNVVAELPGSEWPDEYVIVGGHIDSWDGALGAQDNGTGVATTLEAARLLALAGAQPKRTIRFMLWSGEEQGLLGSGAWVKSHPEELARISAVLVHDEGSDYLAGLSGPKALIEDLRWACEPILDMDSAMPFEVKENEGLSLFGGSDHSSFAAAGVPGFFWDQTGRADYEFIHHTQHDDLRYVVSEYQIHNAKVIASVAYNLANLDHLLDRTDLMRKDGGFGDSTRRRMNVQLEGTEVTEVEADGMAAQAGWKVGDVIVEIDGVVVADRGEVVAELQKGGPKKAFKLRRAGAVIESTLDYTGTPSELAREKRRAEEEAKKQAEGAKSPR
jgi:hypothetical protein